MQNQLFSAMLALETRLFDCEKLINSAQVITDDLNQDFFGPMTNDIERESTLKCELHRAVAKMNILDSLIGQLYELYPRMEETFTAAWDCAHASPEPIDKKGE